MSKDTRHLLLFRTQNKDGHLYKLFLHAGILFSQPYIRSLNLGHKKIASVAECGKPACWRFQAPAMKVKEALAPVKVKYVTKGTPSPWYSASITA
jgi:hypothetical protein